MTETTTIQQFIEAHGLSMIAQPAASNPQMDDPSLGSSHWLCTIKRGAAEFTCHFSRGAAYRRWRMDVDKKKRLASLIPSELADIQPGKPVQQKYWRRTLHLDALRADLSEPTPPELPDVLNCLASDASSLDEGDFANWASSLGYDTDSRKAEATYRTILEQSNKLRAFLGAEAYNALIYNVERL